MTRYMSEPNRIEYKREVTSELDIEKVTFLSQGDIVL